MRCYVYLYCGGRSVDWLAVRSPALTVAKSALTGLRGGVGGELQTGEQQRSREGGRGHNWNL